MELRELEVKIEEYKNKLDQLWRLLWHRKQKIIDQRIRKKS